MTVAELDKQVDELESKPSNPILRFPLRFSSRQEELNLLALESWLFVQGEALFARDPTAAQLLEAHADGRTWQEIVMYGLMSMHISGEILQLDSAFFRALRAHELAQHLNLPITETHQPQPGMELTKQGAARPLVEELLKQVHLLADHLASLQQPHLGTLLVQHHSTPEGSATFVVSAGALAKELPAKVPAFTGAAVERLLCHLRAVQQDPLEAPWLQLVD